MSAAALSTANVNLTFVSDEAATYTAVASTSSGSGVGATLTANANGALSIDSVAVSTSDRVLIKDQADAAQNGIYTVTNTGGAGAAFVLTRATDADTGAELPGGTFIFSFLSTVSIVKFVPIIAWLKVIGIVE